MSDPDAHLLIVDDDERIRGLLQKFLMRHGFLVTAARDAAHARRILSGLDFDLIVLDVMMPGEDGMSLCRDLRARLGTPIMLLTAKGETSDRIAGLEAGADDVVTEDDGSIEVLTSPDEFGAVVEAMNAAGLQADEAEVSEKASTSAEVDQKAGVSLLKMLDVFDELDDVQDVHSNAEFPADFKPE